MPTTYQNQNAVRYYIKEREKFDYRKRGERVIKFADIKLRDYVLDLCCGPGYVAKVIREKIGNEGKLVGVDSSSAFINYAKRICSYENVKFKRGNVENLTKYIGNEKFDFAILLASWDWIKNKNKLFSEIKKALKPSGKFVFSISGDNLYHAATREFFLRFRTNLKNSITKMFPKINLSYIDRGVIIDKKFLNRCVSQVEKKGFRVVSINEVKRLFTARDKLYLYKNPARTEWVGRFKPEERFKIIQKALPKTFKELNLKPIERHTYYVVLELK